MAFAKDIGTCCQCGEQMWLTEATYQTLKRSSAIFYCPFGRQQHYPQGEGEAAVLRRMSATPTL